MVPFLGEIRMFSFAYAPDGWALCDGQTRPISGKYASLGKMLGKTYGGDGVTTFGVPDLRGAAAVNAGEGFVRGSRGGEPGHVLAEVEIPTGPGHVHTLQGVTERADTPLAAGKVFGAAAGANVYAPRDADPAKQVELAHGTVEGVGGAPHENMAPFVAVTFCIAWSGTYPIRP
jgi:microcystin-dependent protein